MVKLALFSIITLCAGGLTFATAGNCKRTVFRTQLVKAACEQGGQRAANEAMKRWVKAWERERRAVGAHSIKRCVDCHSTLRPTYELRADGLDQFVKLGGKLLEKPKVGHRRYDVKGVGPY